MKKIYIVTGGTGFVGNNVIKMLQAKKETIVALVRSEEKVAKIYGKTDIKFFYGDVRNIGDLEQIISFVNKTYDKKEHEYIFIHTASQVYLGGSKKRIKEMFDVNINGVKNVLEICKKYKLRLLYVSSVHAITEQPKRGLITEIENFNHKNVVGKYAKSKAAASALVMDAAKKDGLDAVLVHPAGITGPGDYSDTHLKQMVEDYAKGRIPAATNGGYDFVDVRDVANGVVLAVEKGKAGDCFLLTNKYYSVKELLQILYDLGTGKKIKRSLPNFVAKIGLPFLLLSAKLSKKRPLYTLYSLYTLRSNSNFSHEKASKELGYEPRSLKESLTDTVRFLKEEKII